jgi:hypothetical protein
MLKSTCKLFVSSVIYEGLLYSNRRTKVWYFLYISFDVLYIHVYLLHISSSRVVVELYFMVEYTLINKSKGAPLLGIFL